MSQYISFIWSVLKPSEDPHLHHTHFLLYLSIYHPTRCYQVVIKLLKLLFVIFLSHEKPASFFFRNSMVNILFTATIFWYKNYRHLKFSTALTTHNFYRLLAFLILSHQQLVFFFQTHLVTVFTLILHSFFPWSTNFHSFSLLFAVSRYSPIKTILSSYI